MADDKQRIRAELAGLIPEVDEDLGQFGESDISGKNIITEIGMDSLDTVKYLFLVEEKFGVHMPDEKIDELGLMNIDNLVEYLVENKAG